MARNHVDVTNYVFYNFNVIWDSKKARTRCPSLEYRLSVRVMVPQVLTSPLQTNV
jgi:hypothetical protein